MQNVAIIDYGSGNLHSALKAFERAARESCSALVPVLTSDPICCCPIGSSGASRGRRICRLHARAQRRFWHARGYRRCGASQRTTVPGDLRRHAAHGNARIGAWRHARTSWIGGEVAHITPNDPSLKIPHMGWNTLDVVTPHVLLEAAPTGSDGLHAYFVHSYHFVANSDADIVARTDYGGPITAFVAKDNMAGTQFHPEKSQTLGLSNT